MVAVGVLFGLAKQADAATITVKQGDTLSELASTYQDSVASIKSVNHLENENLIYVGDKLTVGEKQQATQVTQAQQATQATQSASNIVQTQSSVTTPNTAKTATAPTTTPATTSGSVKAQLLAAGGTEAVWDAIVVPESGGNPNAVSPNGYSGLFQTKEAGGVAGNSVAAQTQWAINYANQRYGSLDGAVSFRASHNYW